MVVCYESAEKAGFRDKLFVNFGVLLGIVREKDFIAGDDDVDMCVHADGVTTEQQNYYMNLLDEKGMFSARKKTAYRKDNGKVIWFTFRREQEHAKFCHWWGYEWENYWWWSKGRKWVRPNKFHQDKWGYDLSDEGVALGIPVAYVRKLTEVEFRGLKINIPVNYGAVLDWEYPGWFTPRGGSSKHQAVCVIPKWGDKRLWRVRLENVL